MGKNITELLNITYPVIQGGMAWVAEYHLAAAVSEAGGLGIIAAGAAPAEWVREQIRKVKELTDKPFGVNIILMNESINSWNESSSDTVVSFFHLIFVYAQAIAELYDECDGRRWRESLSKRKIRCPVLGNCIVPHP